MNAADLSSLEPGAAISRDIFIDIHQKKTGAKVSIPCKKELLAILEKYNYEIPHFEDQTINRHIKEIARVADQLDVVKKLTDKYDYFD